MENFSLSYIVVLVVVIIRSELYNCQVRYRHPQGIQVEGPTVTGNPGAPGERNHSDVVQ